MSSHTFGPIDSSLLEHHLVDILHKSILVRVEHVLVVVVVVIPSVGVSRVVLGQHKHQVVMSESGFLTWVGHHILDLLHLSAFRPLVCIHVLIC